VVQRSHCIPLIRLSRWLMDHDTYSQSPAYPQSCASTPRPHSSNFLTLTRSRPSIADAVEITPKLQGCLLTQLSLAPPPLSPPPSVLNTL